MRPYVQALAARKLSAEALDLPRSGRSVVKAEKAVPTFIEKVPAGSIAGGHSYGGRVASMAATQVPYAALLLLSYPLHRPGHPEDLHRRTSAWHRAGRLGRRASSGCRRRWRRSCFAELRAYAGNDRRQGWRRVDC